MSESKLSKAIASIKKKVPSAIPITDKDGAGQGVISTGSIAVDAATIVGGFPRGRVIEVSGMEASGKTTLAMQAAARCQAIGQFVTYIDPEMAMDREFASKIGYDPNDEKTTLFLQPETFEDTVSIVNDIVSTGANDLVIVDSISALLPRKSIEAAELSEAVALRARMMSIWLPRLNQLARKGRSAVVLINQMRQIVPGNAFEARVGEKTTTTGGWAIRFYSSLRLGMKRVRKGSLTRSASDPYDVDKVIEVPVGNEHHVEVIKNKVGAAYRDAPFWIRYDEVAGVWGIDNLQTLFDMAMAQEIIQHKGGGNYVIDETTVRGENQAYQRLLDQPEYCRRLAEQLGIDWSAYEPRRVPVSG